MIKEAIQYVAELVENQEKIFKSESGIEYTDTANSSLKELNPRRGPDTVTVCTLGGFVDMLTVGDMNVGKADTKSDWIVHIVNSKRVHLISAYNQVEKILIPGIHNYPKREMMVEAEAPIDEFNFGRWMSQEEFMIGIATHFLPDENLELLYAYAKDIVSVDDKNSSDNGSSITRNSKKWAGSVLSVRPENPIKLRPVRTFVEIEQPMGSYVYRIRSSPGQDGEIEIALFGTSGRNWELVAMRSIQKWLGKECEEKGIWLPIIA